MSVGVALDGATFDEFVGASDVPVLVDFWAEWCGPCKMFDPVLAALADEDHRFVLASVDTDASPELARRFAVMSAPTVVLLHDGEVVWRAVGARGLTQLRDDLDPSLSSLRQDDPR
jgi:thioredoxin 1